MLACTLLIHQMQEGKKLPFKCAIFFSPRMAPLDYIDLTKGTFTEVDAGALIDKIGIPTTMIWGSADPNAPRAIELQNLFCIETLSTYVHHGNHEVPGYALGGALAQTVKIIRRTTDQVDRMLNDQGITSI